MNTGRKGHLPTLEDVARAAKVSLMTVSNVANARKVNVREETRKKVLEAVEGLGYRPQLHARSLRIARSHCIGMFIGMRGSDSLATPWTSRMVSSVSTTLSAAGYVLVLDIQPIDDVSSSALLKNSFVDGIVAIVSGQPEERAALWERLLALGRPVVALQETLKFAKDKDVAVLRQNERAGGNALAKHLSMTGVADIRYLQPNYSRPNMEERLEGARRVATRSNGIAFRTVDCLDESFHSVSAAIEQDIRTAGPPGAYMAANELIALAAMDALDGMGHRVPQDVMLTCFNAFDLWFYAKKKITTVSFDAEAMGRLAAETILSRQDDGAFKRRETVLPGTFIQGETTAPTGRRAAPLRLKQ